MSSELTLRQRLVAEIGDEGQARIGRSIAVVGGGGDAGEIEARYLACAGFSEVRVRTARQRKVVREAAPSAHVEQTNAAPIASAPLMIDGADPVVADLLAGASRALRTLRNASRS